MDDEIGGGIPITISSTLIILSVLSCGCSIITLGAMIAGWSDPTWTTDMKIVGLVCAGIAALFAAACLAFVIIRRLMKNRRRL